MAKVVEKVKTVFQFFDASESDQIKIRVRVVPPSSAIVRALGSGNLELLTEE